MWEVYEVFRPVALEERCIVQVNLEAETLGKAARNLLALWRPAAAEIKAAPLPLIHPEEPKPAVGAITLPELAAEVKPHDRPPRLATFPDGHQKSLKAWKGLLVAVASWVEPKLRGDQVSIKLGERFLLNAQAVHSDGQAFRAPVQVGKLWLETHFSAKDCVHHACRPLEAVGVSPDQVRVEF